MAAIHGGQRNDSHTRHPGGDRTTTGPNQPKTAEGREGMTDSARRRGLATAGALALKCATDPRPTLDRTDRSHTKITTLDP